MGGKIRSGLTMPDLRETFPILSPARFTPFLHKYAMSLAPPLLTLPAFAFAALEPVARIREHRGEGRRAREREREREIYRRSSILHRAMAGGPVILPADPWDPCDVSVEMLL